MIARPECGHLGIQFYLLDLYSIYIISILSTHFRQKQNHNKRKLLSVNIFEFSLALDLDNELKLCKLEPDTLR